MDEYKLTSSNLHHPFIDFLQTECGFGASIVVVLINMEDLLF